MRFGGMDSCCGCGAPCSLRARTGRSASFPVGARPGEGIVGRKIEERLGWLEMLG